MFDPIIRMFGVGMQKTDEPAEGASTAEPERTTAQPERMTAEPERTTAGPEGTTTEPEGAAAGPEATTTEPEGAAEPETADDAHAHAHDHDHGHGHHWPRHWPLLLLGAAVVPGVVLFAVGRWMEEPAVQAWRTVCLSITVQALPFLLLGTALSGAISAFVPARVFTRVLPRRPSLAVPVAGAAGVILPGCECASVPVAHSLIRRGSTRPPPSRSCCRRPPSTRSS